MPVVNEINAPYYLKVKYNTQIARHLMHLYMVTGSTLVTPTVLFPGDYGIVRAGVGSAVRVSQIVREIFNRFKASLNTGTVVESIEIWAGVAGANVFQASNVVDNTGSVGTGSGIASAHRILIFAAPDRSKFRLNFFDTTDAKPQRYPSVTPPLIDDGGLLWQVLRSDAALGTNDGTPLTQSFSDSSGYNRRLARKYGLTVAP